MVSGAQGQRLLQAHLYGTGLAHRHGGLALQKHDAADDLGRAGHHMHTRTRFKHARLGALAAQVGERHHKAQRLTKTARHAQHLATVKRRGTVTNQVERHALPRQRARRIAMHLNPAHTTDRTRRQSHQLVAHRHRRIVQRSRHDGADALDRKAAVNRQARRGTTPIGTVAAGIPASGNLLVEHRKQPVDPLACLGRHRHDRRARKHGTRQKVIDIELGKLGHLGIGQVTHRQRDHHMRDAQQLQHVHVLARLRHYTLNGRDHQHGNVDACRTLHHGAQVMSMPRHVDQADDLATRQRQLAKAQLHGHTTTTLDLKAIGILAGQRLDQCRLTVVDVARRANDNRTLHQRLNLTHRAIAFSTHATSVDAAVSISRSPTSVRTSNRMRSCEVRVTTGVSKSWTSERLSASTDRRPSTGQTATHIVGSSTVGSEPPPGVDDSSTISA